MKVGVTGGSGFIGGYVCEELAARGHEPLIFDHVDRPSQFERMLGDARDPIAMAELAAHTDGIIHLAAILGTQETVRRPRPAVLTNIEAGLAFLEALDQYDIPGVNICVGNHWMLNSYSTSKTCVERLCHQYRRELGTRVNCVRAVNAYGPRQAVAAPFGPGKVRKITPSFVCRALAGLPVEVYGSGEQVSDMVYVADVARALVDGLTAEWSETVDVGPPVSTTVLEVAKLVIDLCESDSPVELLPMRPGESSEPVTAQNRYDIAYTPLLEGMGRTVDWYRANEGVTWRRPS